MFERFDDQARQAVVYAQDEAVTLGNDWLGTEHLLLGVLRDTQSASARLLADHGVHIDAIRSGVRAVAGRDVSHHRSETPGHVPFTTRSTTVMHRSLAHRATLGDAAVTPGHLLLALVQLREGVGFQVLSRSGADVEAVECDVVNQLIGPDT